MTLLNRMNAAFTVRDGLVYWSELGKPAGDRKGLGKRIRFEGVRYCKDSVIEALNTQDESALVVLAFASPEASQRTQELVTALRQLLSTAQSREDALAIYRTIELLEEGDCDYRRTE